MKKTPVWQKRFKTPINPFVLEFTSSIADDEELVPYDIFCSLAHTGMLAKKGIISRSDCNKIKKGLKKILSDYKKGKFKLLPEYEDVHMNIEFQLKKIIGDTAEKLHTARSRNDLIATELRLFVRDKIALTVEAIVRLQLSIVKTAQKYSTVIIPGYTHLQQAQPILVGFYLSSFFYKFQRDFEQVSNLYQLANVSPLGGCAFAGTGIDIDRLFLANKLGFPRISENALDGVSDRDFLGDTIYYLTRINIHLSNLAEDLIVFATKEFNLVELDDAITTGSSIMPHKKNPDVCEILRARSGHSIGNLVSVLTILKGLPSSYNRDLQELKSILIRQIKETGFCLNIASLIVENTKFLPPKKEWENRPNWMCINDLIDFLVKKGYSFRSAYDSVAQMIKQSMNDMNSFVTLLAKKTGLSVDTIITKLTPASSIKNKISRGGTGSDSVKSLINQMKRLSADNKKRIARMFVLDPNDSADIMD